MNLITFNQMVLLTFSYLEHLIEWRFKRDQFIYENLSSVSDNPL